MKGKLKKFKGKVNKTYKIQMKRPKKYQIISMKGKLEEFQSETKKNK